jgi:hypothetical protein
VADASGKTATSITVDGSFQDVMSGLFLSFKVCFWKTGTKGKIDVTVRRRKRRKQVLDDLKEKRGNWELKQEGLERTL